MGNYRNSIGYTHSLAKGDEYTEIRRPAYWREYIDRYPYRPTTKTEVIAERRTLLERVIAAVREMGYAERILSIDNNDSDKVYTIQVKDGETIVTLKAYYNYAEHINTVTVVDNGE